MDPAEVNSAVERLRWSAPFSRHRVGFGRAARVAVALFAALAIGVMPVGAASPTGGQRKTQPVRANTRSEVPSRLAEGLTLAEAMASVFGKYDRDLGGSFWRAEGLTGDAVVINGEEKFVQPHSTQRFLLRGRERVLLVTNTLDIEDGRIIRPGESCHACAVLVGMILFERGPGEGWRLVSANRAATRAGSWGRMPRATIIGSFAAPALRIEDGFMAQGQISEWTTIVRYSDGQFRPRIVSIRRSCVGGPPCVTTSDKAAGSPAAAGRRP